MAKKRKTRKTKKAEEIKSSGFWRGVGAVALIVAGIVLAFGWLINAPIPQGFWDGTWDLFGVATVMAPLLLVYLGTLKFLSEDGQIPLAKMAGSIGLVVFLAGLVGAALALATLVGASVVFGESLAPSGSFLVRADFIRAALFWWKRFHFTPLSIIETAFEAVSAVTFLRASLISALR